MPPPFFLQESTFVDQQLNNNNDNNRPLAGGVATVADGGVVHIDLTGPWMAKNANGSVSVEGQVPGSIHVDLQRAGIIGDPYYRSHHPNAPSSEHAFHFLCVNFFVQKS